MPLYQFTCSCGKTFDEKVPAGTQTAKCGCGHEAHKDFLPTSNFLLYSRWSECTGYDLSGRYDRRLCVAPELKKPEVSL